MKSNPKGVVLKGGVTDPGLPGKVFFGPGVRNPGFILRKLREQVVEIGKEMSSYVARAIFQRNSVGFELVRDAG